MSAGEFSPASVRAAALEEAATECERMHAIHKNAHTYYGYAASRIRALSPASSDAGKDDARDAARYRWIAEQGSLRDEFRSPDFARVCQFFNDLGGQLLGEAIDDAMARAALSSLEVIGKGEKG